MPTLKVSKSADAGNLYAEIIAAVPELAPTPTGPDGRLEAHVIVEQAGPRSFRVHVLDDVDEDVTAAVDRVIGEHRKQ